MHEKKYLVLFASLLFLVGSTSATAQESSVTSNFKAIEGNAAFEIFGNPSSGVMFRPLVPNGTDTAGTDPEVEPIPYEKTLFWAELTDAGAGGTEEEVETVISDLTAQNGVPAGAAPPVVLSLGMGTTLAATISPATLAAAMSPMSYPAFVSALQAGTLGLTVTGPSVGVEGSVVIAIPPATAKFYFAQFGNGGGLTSDITLVNTSNTTNLDGTVSFYDPDGNSLPVGIAGDAAPAGPQTETDVDFELTRYAKTVISTDGIGDLIQGSIGIEVLGVDNSGDPRLPSINASVRFTFPGLGIAGFGPGQVFGDATNGSSSPVVVAPAPQTGTSGAPVKGLLTTGTAVRNVSGQEITVRGRLFDADGNGVDNADVDVVLPVNARTSRQLTALFPDVDFSGGFSGVLRYTTRGGGNFVTLALENGTEAGEFTAVHSTGRQVRD